MLAKGYMNTYILFVDNHAPYYIRASYSYVAVNWLQAKLGVQVNAWDVATSLPSQVNVMNAF